MASRWDRIRAMFGSKMREPLEEDGLRAAEEWDYARSQAEREDRGTRPDPEVLAEQNYIERGAAMMEDEGIAYHEQLGRDDDAKPIPEGMMRLYHGGRGPIEEARWFTSSLSFAGGAARKVSGQVFHIDLPNDYPLPPRVWPTQDGISSTWNGHLSEELSRQAKPLAQNRELDDFDRHLDEYAERGKYISKEPDKGIDR